MNGTVDLALLPAFVEVVRQGGFTAAAAQLRIPKSTLSRRVARLERALGVALLARTTRTVRLTDAGADLYAEASLALERLEEATQSVVDRRLVPRGTLRVTAPTDLGDAFLAGVITRFVARYPEVRVDLSLTGRVVDLVGEGFDAALRAGPLRDSSLVARRIGVADLALFASTRYLAERGEPAGLDDLASHDCVLFRPQDGVSRWTLEGPDGARAIEMRGSIGADEFGFVAEAVRAGAGIGLTSEPLVASDVERGSIRRVLPEWRVGGSAIHLVYPGARHLPAKLVVFRDFLIEAFASWPWKPPSSTDP